jgi:hypothetical protein
MKLTPNVHTKQPARRTGSRRRGARGRPLVSRVWRGMRQLMLWIWQIVRHSGGWLLPVLWRIVRFLSRATQQLGTWLLYQILAPCVCFGCIYSGVLMTLLLPASLWSALIPANIVSLVPPFLPSLPLPEIPDAEHVGRALLAALPLSVHVFRHGYLEWKTSLDPLGARILYACAVGVTWPKIWFRRKQTPANLS